jgi:hypothetical protein
MKFVITFFNHFGAVRYKREAGCFGWKVQLSPVPRALSSSCGTCVFCDCGADDPLKYMTDEMEQIAREEGNGYHILWRAEDS